MSHTVILFYKYVAIADPDALRADIINTATRLKLTGRVLVAHEGINGTLEGLPDTIQEFEQWILSDTRFSDMSIKHSAGDGLSFKKLKIKVRNEIVGTQFGPDIDPTQQTGVYITPEQLRAWYENNEDFTVIDMRNDYEYASGHFRNSIHPGIQASRDLPDAVATLAPLKDKKVLTVCTGGVRCEKMSAYLMNQGFKDVYQLHDGMHGYMEKYPGQDFLGTLYTFDNRLTMHFGGDREIVGRCRHCATPTENYFNCNNMSCHFHFLACDKCANTEQAFCSITCQQSGKQ